MKFRQIINITRGIFSFKNHLENVAWRIVSKALYKVKASGLELIVSICCDGPHLTYNKKNMNKTLSKKSRQKKVILRTKRALKVK